MLWCFIFRGSCDADHCLAVAEVRGRLLLSKRAAQKFNMERFYLKRLYEVEVRE
jgi:hypothetical protein